jgi:hypothetical protein
MAEPVHDAGLGITIQVLSMKSLQHTTALKIPKAQPLVVAERLRLVKGSQAGVRWCNARCLCKAKGL